MRGQRFREPVSRSHRLIDRERVDDRRRVRRDQCLGRPCGRPVEPGLFYTVGHELISSEFEFVRARVSTVDQRVDDRKPALWLVSRFDRSPRRRLEVQRRRAR